MANETEAKLTRLKNFLRELSSVAVAFSGGINSTFPLKVAHKTLDDNVLALTASSEFVPQRELGTAKNFLSDAGFRQLRVRVHGKLARIEIQPEDFPQLMTIRAARFPYTRELARIGTVDPTGATYLKLYGMWHVENPWSFFRDVYRPNSRANFTFMCIINRETFYRLYNVRKLFAWAKVCDGLRLAKVRVKNPDTPDTFRDALLVRYEI